MNRIARRRIAFDEHMGIPIDGANICAGGDEEAANRRSQKRKPNALICRTRNGVKGEALRPISRKMRQSKKMVKPPDIEGMMKGKVPASVEGPR